VGRVQFKITRHSGRSAPTDALELLWGRVEGRSFENVVFAQRGRELSASVGRESPVSMERDEREEQARREVLECLRQICDGASELRVEWFAVSLRR
jgi:hypothetical protein